MIRPGPLRPWPRGKMRVARNDIPTQRAMIKRAFPKLTLAPPRHFNDHGPERFHWDGPTT
jgi:hypothetical protein